MKRRGFLGGILASPLALKAAAEEKIASLSNIYMKGTTQVSTSVLEDIVARDSWGGESVGISGESWTARGLKELRLLKTFAPQLLEKKRRADARRVHEIDPDLAGLQSMSLAAKIAFQRERLYKRSLEEEQTWIERLEEEAIRRSLG